MGGDSTWRKMKLALGLNTCLHVSRSTDDGEYTHAPTRNSDVRHRMPSTPTPPYSGIQSSTYSTTSSTAPICAICLMSVKAANDHAIFTAECSHSFHFHCITSNVKHGNRICPICRAKWKEIPVEKSGSRVVSRTNSDSRSCQDYTVVGMRPQQLYTYDNVPLLYQARDPPIFDDDDEIINQKAEDILSGDSDLGGGVEMRTYSEVSAVARSTRYDNFGILINLKAPVAKGDLNARASIDLVAVLDVSGSMTGTKVELLKQAMGFVVHNLGPLDRLSVIAFSSSAHRLFPLRRMTDTGKHESLQIINSLVADGSTNIAGALRKGAKVMTDRKFKNPVSSMILLSDGQDSKYNNSPRTSRLETKYQALLPYPIQGKKDETHIPIHTFGFGKDHDACAMHFISEHSGGMFSFIEAESAIQDAFAQCLGGLLSVVVQDLRVEVDCVHPMLRLGSIEAGSYKVGMDEIKRSGFIEVGDLYAEEERDFLVEMDIPADKSGKDMPLVKFKVSNKDPIRKTVVTVGGNEDVVISRPKSTPEKQTVSSEVDRQRNRLRGAIAIAKARTLAERGYLEAATSVLDVCRKELLDSVSGRDGDRFCTGLVAELQEMIERMVNHKVYESTGRAYVLSGLSSHSWQRATARGDSTEVTSEIQSYQTTSMVNMVNLSHTQTFSLNPSTTSTINDNDNPAAEAPSNKK